MDQQAAQAQQQQQPQQQLLLQQHQQQQQQQQFLLFQQLQKQAQQQQHQAAAAAAMSRFPSNIDAHLRPPGMHRQFNLQQQQNPNPNPNPNSNLQQQQQQGANLGQNAPQGQPQQQQQHQQHLQKGAIRPIELQMAYQDAWRVCHPDFKRPFSSLEDACERLLPYHVVADYEAEEDDRILDSDTTGQMPSRSQQWDHNIAAKVAEFTGTFEKQALAFNIITRKRAMGEFRSEERLMIEQALLQEEKRMLFDLKAEMDAREKAGREAQLRMAAQQEMMARTPIRASALGPQGSNDLGDHDHNINPDEMMNGWGNNGAKDEKEPSEDFLNDEETENGDTSAQGEWREVGEFDLNSR